MNSYKIKLPRGLEVDIFNLPKDFENQIKNAFRDYTRGTAKEYMYVDKLGFIDRCVGCLNGDEDSDDVVSSKVKEYMCHTWDDQGEIASEDDIYSFEFMVSCYESGNNDAKLSSHFGIDDHYIYDQIHKVLAQIITIVMNYEDEEDTKC